MSFNQGPEERTRPRLEYHWIDNFSAGIINRVQYVGGSLENTATPSQPGAAQVNGTYGCVGLPDGGLAPGPRVVAMDEHDAYTPTGGTISIEAYFGCGIFAVGPVFPFDTPLSVFSPESYEMVVSSDLVVSDGPDAGFGAFLRTTDKTRYLRSWLPELNFTGGVTSFHGDDVNAFLIPGTSFAEARTILEADSDITEPGRAVVVSGTTFFFSGQEGDTGFGQGFISSFPDPNIDDGDTELRDILSGFNVFGAAYVLNHQGRVLVAQAHKNYFGNDTYETALVSLVYTDPNDIYSTKHTLYIGEMGVDGIHSMYSVNASELLLIRARGGAISIRGDLDNPTVVRYPGVQGTEGARTVGTNSPIGYIYGARSGIFAWRGGDESIHLSPKMSGAFWMSQDPDDLMDRRILHGSFAFSNPFVFCPNNYMYDTRTGGWWRYAPIGGFDNEAVTPALPNSGFGYHSLGPHSGDVYAQCWTNYDYNNDFRMLARIIKDEQTSQYSYKSQPLTWSLRRIVGVREIVLYAQGTGTVRVTLTSAIEPEGPQEYLFTINAPTHPKRILTDGFYFQGSDVVFTIEADSGDPDTPAPTVWAIGFGEADEVSL